MDEYTENKSAEDMINIIEHIERYLLVDAYETAFIAFLLHSERMTSINRTELILWFRRYFTTKYERFPLSVSKIPDRL